MSYTVTEANLDQLGLYWQEHPNKLNWEPIFVIPAWLKAWQQTFAPDAEFYIPLVKQSNRIIGIAPLLIKDGIASIIGNPDVCDYVDFLVAPAKEDDFTRALLENLKEKSVSILEPGVYRPESRVIASLINIARQLGYEVSSRPDEVSLETNLPATWDKYLQSLEGKQRHEVRRKLKRLEEAGDISYHFITEASSVPDFMDTFLKMFVESRKDKNAFLTGQRETFFRRLASSMAEVGLLRASILKLDDAPVAALLAFDYHDTVYLYNSGYDPQRRNLSVGIISKVLLIKDSIERGKNKFDFLKGSEHYKYQLGGKEVRLQSCRIALSNP